MVGMIERPLTGCTRSEDSQGQMGDESALAAPGKT